MAAATNPSAATLVADERAIKASVSVIGVGLMGGHCFSGRTTSNLVVTAAHPLSSAGPASCQA